MSTQRIRGTFADLAVAFRTVRIGTVAAYVCDDGVGRRQCIILCRCSLRNDTTYSSGTAIANIQYGIAVQIGQLDALELRRTIFSGATDRDLFLPCRQSLQPSPDAGGGTFIIEQQIDTPIVIEVEELNGLVVVPARCVVLAQLRGNGQVQTGRTALVAAYTFITAVTHVGFAIID